MADPDWPVGCAVLCVLSCSERKTQVEEEERVGVLLSRCLVFGD